MVAPSLEIVVSLVVVIILSIPLGPNVVLMTSTIASTALMFDIICPIPYIDSVPSRKRRIVGCYSIRDKLQVNGSSLCLSEDLNIFKIYDINLDFLYPHYILKLD